MGLEIGNAKTGFIWSLIERFSVQGIQFILSLVIARLVTPARLWPDSDDSYFYGHSPGVH